MCAVQEFLRWADSFAHDDGVRHCTIDGVKHWSVLDVIGVIVGSAKYVAWQRLKEQQEWDTASHVFDLQNRRETPVATAPILLDIVFALPGRAASDFRRSGVRCLFNVINPDAEFIEKMKQRLESQGTLARTSSPLTSAPPLPLPYPK
jgi:hypothetical protein